MTARALEIASGHKSEFLASMSHELRTPLNAVIGFSDVLLERMFGELNERQEEYVRDIRDSGRHLLELINEILDLSKVEAGRMELDPAQLSLPELLEQGLALIRERAARQHLTVTLAVAPEVGDVWADEVKLKQVVVNLLTNAVKFTPVGGSVDVDARVLGEEAIVSVRDTGVGIAPEHIDRIFEPFERLETMRGQPGVGLGLTITRLLVDIMGGQLTVDSAPGRGSSFRVKMFFSEAPPREDRRAPDPRSRRYAGARRHILIADDDTAHLDLMRDLLTPIGFDLDFAADGEAAIEAFRRRPPDLVILDIAMPVLNGWDAARRIRAELSEDVPILMVSANVHDFQRLRLPDDPHDDYLLKPYEISVLLDRIGVLLDLEWTSPQGAQA
jgi:CheY-like chemotaxis protein